MNTAQMTMIASGQALGWSSNGFLLTSHTPDDNRAVIRFVDNQRHHQTGRFRALDDPVATTHRAAGALYVMRDFCFVDYDHNITLATTMTDSQSGR